MSQKVKKYIDFLKNPTNYIKNEKVTCDAVNSLVIETDALVQLMDKDTRQLIQSTFPQISQIKCGQSIASLLNNTHFTNLNDLVQILIAKYLYIIKLLGDEEVPEPVKNCDNIKDMVDKVIKITPLEDLLSSNNIFAEKPITYVNNTPTDKTKELLSSFKRELVPIMTFKDRNLEIISNRDLSIITLFDEKKKFADIITTEMSSKYLFADTKKNIISDFQYLVNTMFNKRIEEYIQSLVKSGKYAYDPKMIVFIYKGGTTMKILFDKYKHILPNNKAIFNDYKDYFSRSDSDYAIYINQNVFNTAESYNRVLLDINKLVFNTLSEIQNMISNNLECICPLESITTSDLKNLLDKLNAELVNSKAINKLPSFTNIKKLIGISFNNKHYFSDNVPTNLSNATIHSFIDPVYGKDKNQSASTVYIESKKQQFKRQQKIDTKRADFVIKVHDNKKDKVTKSESDYVSSICDANKPFNPHGIYYYMNETNKFFNNNLLNEFNLHRLKINAILYYVYDDGVKVKYGYFNAPSELIDISISSNNDDKIKGVDLDKIIKQYKNDRVEFNSYSLYGFLDDLYKGMFGETRYPWEAGKFEKKIVRIMILLFIYINNKYNDTKVLYTKFITFLNNIINDTYVMTNADKDNFININLKEKNPPNKVITLKNDYLINRFFVYILQKYDFVVAETTNKKTLMDKFKLMIGKFNEVISKLKPENVNSGYNSVPENVPYLDKYLKYKTKYYALLKKLGKI